MRTPLFSPKGSAATTALVLSLLLTSCGPVLIGFEIAGSRGNNSGTTPPLQFTLSGPPLLSASRTALFQFGASRQVARFEYDYDRLGRRPVVNAGLQLITNVAPGVQHTFQLYAVDQDGITTAAPLYIWEVDDSPPVFSTWPSSPSNAAEPQFVVETRLDALEGRGDWQAEFEPIPKSAPFTVNLPMPAVDGPRTFEVRGIDAQGGRGLAGSYTWVVDTQPPTMPQGLEAESVDATAMELSWSASTDPGGSGGLKYEVSHRIRGASGWSPEPRTAQTALALSGLRPCTDYEFAVRAIDAAGNASDPGAVVVQRTGCGGTGAFEELIGAVDRFAGSPNSMAIADFNADGIADLAVALDSNEIKILLGTGSDGQGTGRFARAPLQPYWPVTAPRSILAADLDSDGITDLAYGGLGTVSLCRGRQTGGWANAEFDPPMVKMVSAIGTVSRLVTADLDRNGKLDIVAGGDRNLGVLWANSSGAFAPDGFDTQLQFPVLVGVTDIALGDFDADGRDDLAVIANFQTSQASWTLLWTFRQLSRSFNGFQSPIQAISAGAQLITSDFNTDGITDLAVSDPTPFGTGGVSIYRGLGADGRGDGLFGPPSSYAPGNGFHSLAHGDFDGDGIDDLALTGNPMAQPVALDLLLGEGTQGQGNGSFGAPMPYPMPSSAPTDIVVGDVHGDGILDILVADTHQQTIRVMEGVGATLLGNGLVREVRQIDSLLPISALSTADLNEDDVLDLLAVSELTSLTFHPGLGRDGRGQGALGSGTGYTSFLPWQVATADFDRDSITDLLVLDSPFYPLSYLLSGPPTASTRTPFGGSFSVHLGEGSDGRGDGRLASGVTTRLPLVRIGTEFADCHGAAIAVGNFDHDGITDVAVLLEVCPVQQQVLGQPTQLRLAMYRGDGDGGFALPQISEPVGSWPLGLLLFCELGAGDFNDDGNLDLAVIYSWVAQAVPYSRYQLLLGDGTGRFTPQGPAISLQPSILYPRTLLAFDFDADRELDLAFLSFGYLHVLFGGTPAVERAYPVNNGTALVHDDFNGDGIGDFAVSTSTSGRTSVEILLGGGTQTRWDRTLNTPLRTWYEAGPQVGWPSLTSGDFDSDGVRDLVVSFSTRAAFLLLGDGVPR